ncbi:MAG: HlyD family efflux transporter periplasmic adaptor subunit [Bacteroidota bacterium]
MLNISNNSLPRDEKHDSLQSIKMMNSRKEGKVFLKLLIGLLIAGIIMLFMPWTQFIRARGLVTALTPDQRPQTVQSLIDGRIEKWFVQEGDFIQQGDTILFISEIKDKFRDPNLVGRTKEQLEAKEFAVGSYMDKVRALDVQIDALNSQNDLKLEQARNKLKQARLKVSSDSIKVVAEQTNVSIAKDQLRRGENLFEQELISKVKVEERRNKYQAAQAKVISAENQLLDSQNDVLNAKVELSQVNAEFRNKIAKAESEKATAMSNMYDAEVQVTKLQTEYTNYSLRDQLYYITAPQDGFVSVAAQSGIGETIKAGGPVLSIVPANYELAIEMFVEPIDLPLLQLGQKVQTQFDGWPAIVFSGWPNSSYGTYTGRIVAIDNFISKNGKYRILVAPDNIEQEWPDALRMGAGASSLVLLNDVPVWYELWRQLNGFPPDYYKSDDGGGMNKDANKK